MKELPNGSVNPNAGRPVIAGSNNSGGWTSDIRDTLRFSGYGELDLSQRFNKNSILGKILGRHVFTGLLDRYSVSTDSRGYFTTMIASDPANWQSVNPQNVEQAYHMDAWVYLGNPVNNLTTAHGLNLSLGQVTHSAVAQWLGEPKMEWQKVLGA